MNLSKISLYCLFVVFVFFLMNCNSDGWRTASRESAQIAPLPHEETEAIVHIYAAPLWGLRGIIADHTWISTKEKGASSYKVYELVGWYNYMGEDGETFLRIAEDIPDRLWYGNKPRILFELKGSTAEPIVSKIEELASMYPYKAEYTMIPGPNSNTFTAWMICQIPELEVKLSRRAIGKNYLEECPLSK